MKRFIALAVLAGLSLPVQAEDLLAVYAEAQQRDATWLAAEARYRAGVEKLPQARSALHPSVTLSADTRHNEQAVKTPSIDDEFNYRVDDYSLEMRQTLYDSGRLSDLRQSRHQVAQATAEKAAADQELLLRSASTYLELLAAREALTTATAERIATARQRDLARRNFDVGAASTVDVHEAAARLDQVRLSELAAREALDRQRELMRRLIGRVPARLNGPGAGLEPESITPDDVEAWAVRARTANLDVAVQKQVFEIARELVTRARRGFYPTLELVASHNYLDSGGNIFGFGSRTRTNQIGLEFEMPLYQGGLLGSKLRERRALRSAAQQDLVQVERAAEQTARDAYNLLQNAIQRLRILASTRTSTRRALESTRLAYEKGARSGIDVLNSQREYYRSELDLARARYDYLLARLSLRAAVGELGQADIVQVNRSLTRDIALTTAAN